FQQHYRPQFIPFINCEASASRLEKQIQTTSNYASDYQDLALFVNVDLGRFSIEKSKEIYRL
ncbi:MAG TPA: hypothetical protein VIS10_15095, partial [Anaerolineales bacterium]